jgi:uncharacterized protein YjaG (DUF416 family)
MERFDPDSIRQKAAHLSGWQRVAFMAACCERMLPNYETFHMQTGFGNPGVLRRELDAVWAWIESDAPLKDAAELISQVDLQTPNTEEFKSAYTSAALDAANSIAITLEAMNGVSEDGVAEVASLARDSVDLFVQQHDDLDPSDLNFEHRIMSSPLMQAELAAQTQSLKELAENPNARSLVARTVKYSFSMRSLPG